MSKAIRQAAAPAAVLVAAAILAALLIATAVVATDAKAGPKDWSYTAVAAGTVPTFPQAYALPFGFADKATLHIKATCSCGANTITVNVQGSLDGTTYFDESFMRAGGVVTSSLTFTGTTVLNETLLLGRQDTATIFHPGLFFPTYRVNMTSSGGTPTLSAVDVMFYAPGRTR